MVKLRLIGKHSLVVFHRWMAPGEVRELHADQAAQLEVQYPGEFERVGEPAMGEDTPQPEPEPAEDIKPESEPVNDAIPDVEVPKVEVSDVNPPVDSGRPPAGGRSTPRRRAKR
jgi:hypothetical protein